jgi:hypothetical protein
MLHVPDTCLVYLAGQALDTAGTRCLNPQVLMDPAPKARENILLPGYGYLPRGFNTDQRTVDIDVLVDGTYSRAGTLNADPVAGAQVTIDWLEENVYYAEETGDTVAAEVRDTASGVTRGGRVQINDMTYTSGSGDRLRVITFEVLLPLGRLVSTGPASS